MQQGRGENAQKISRQLLNLLENQTITQTTGWRIEEIQNVREESQEGKKDDRTISTPFLITGLSLVRQVFEDLSL